MAKSQSNLADRPGKPRPDFPLFAHRNGQWAKKIKGRLYYFGPWSDVNGAIDRYSQQRDDLYAGRKPRPVTPDGLTMREVSNQFLTSKKSKLESGDLSKRHFDDLHRACDTVIKAFGRNRSVEDLRPDDFRSLRSELAKRYGTTSLKREISNIRQIFNFAYKNDLIDRPVKFGSEFSAPSKKKFREERHSRGSRMISPDELSVLLMSASPHMKAIILLGLNAGLGNSDIAFMREHHIDPDGGWLQYPRRKTAVNRRAKLWPETITAIKKARDGQREAKQEQYRDLVFVTRCGSPWADEDRDSAISKEFRKLLDKHEMYRRGRSFYSLRHIFRTVADQAKDPPAIDLVMGHDNGSMAATYRDPNEGISDERLQAVANHVHAWLFGKGHKPK